MRDKTLTAHSPFLLESILATLRRTPCQHPDSHYCAYCCSEAVGGEVHPVAAASATRAVRLQNLYRSTHHHRRQPCEEEELQAGGWGLACHALLDAHHLLRETVRVVAADILQPYRGACAAIHRYVHPLVYHRDIVKRR